MASLDEDQLCSIVASLVKDAEKYRDDRSKDRVEAMAYFDGTADDLQKYIPAEEGRSRVLSRDVRSSIKKVLPSIYRTILGGDEVVEYQPVGPDDEESAEQATDFVNYVILPECDGRQAIEDGIFDAIRLRNGIIKWWLDEKTDVQVSLHTGLDDMSFAQLVSGDDIEVLEHTESAEEVQTEQGMVPATVHDVRIKRRITKRRPMLSAIAPENWLIHSEAIRLEDSPILGENYRLRRSDLIRMGYDYDTIWAIPAASSGPSEQEAEEDARRRDVEQKEDAPQKALDEVEYYDLLVRVDQDGDGIAELRRMIFAGGIMDKYLLENVEWDEIHYADIVSERRAHQWEGTSVPDDVMEIQKVNTVLLRQTMDNLYATNMPQPQVEEGSIVNPEAVMNPQFGLPIRFTRGTDVNRAISWRTTPFVADKSFAMIEYMKNEATDRTGISDASSGMAPDALQNMTAKASSMVEAAGIGQTEMMVRTIATSLKPVFRGLLKLIIQHQDKPRTVRLRDKWVTFDPRSWNADMDATVNTGLGAGTRERDMMAMMQVIGLQKDILASMGPAVGMQYVSPDNLYNAISRLVQAAGLKTVGLYFSKPEAQVLQQAMAAKQPNPEEIKAQAALQLEDKRTQGRLQVEQVKAQQKQAEFGAKMQSEASKEREQLQADLQTEIARLEAQTQAKRQELMAQAALNEQDNAAEFDREVMKQQTEREWMDTQQRIAAAKIVADSERAVMQEAGRARDRQMAPDGNRQGRGGV